MLIKDNHLAGMSIADAVVRARSAWPGRGIEIECDRADQVDEAVAAGADVVMLDNMTPDERRSCVALVAAAPFDAGRDLRWGTVDSVAAYAATGADLISTSTITQSAPALDIGLDLAAE